jgi:hypothetical protein
LALASGITARCRALSNELDARLLEKSKAIQPEKQ